MGAYAKWLGSNSDIKEALKAKILAGKLKDSVDEISTKSSSTTNSIRKIKTAVAAAKKVANQAASKISALNR